MSWVTWDPKSTISKRSAMRRYTECRPALQPSPHVDGGVWTKGVDRARLVSAFAGRPRHERFTSGELNRAPASAVPLDATNDGAGHARSVDSAVHPQQLGGWAGCPPQARPRRGPTPEASGHPRGLGPARPPAATPRLTSRP